MPATDASLLLQTPISVQSLPRRFKITDLGTFIPDRINKYGVIVGNVNDGKGPAIWKNGIVHTLPPDPNVDSTVAVDINDNGAVVGYGTNANPNAPFVLEADIWGPSAGPPSVYQPGMYQTIGAGISTYDAVGTVDGNQVVDLQRNRYIDNGNADAENNFGTVLYDSGGTVCEMTATQQRTCFPKAPGAVQPVQGVDLNDHGGAIANDPVLCHAPNDCIYRGVYYHAGIETVIYAPSGSNTLKVSGINNNGWIVGAYGLNVPDNNAFVYVNGKMTPLNSFFSPTSGIYLDSAKDVNDAGEIVGTYKGAAHGYLLRPVY